MTPHTYPPTTLKRARVPAPVVFRRKYPPPRTGAFMAGLTGKQHAAELGEAVRAMRVTAEGEMQPGEAGEAGENPAETFAFAHARYRDTPLRLLTSCARGPEAIPQAAPGSHQAFIHQTNARAVPAAQRDGRRARQRFAPQTAQRQRSDPVRVLQVGSRAFSIEGHHRLQAYKEEGKPDIPIKPFKGTIEQAVAFAGRVNSRLKLSMTNGERQNSHSSLYD